MGRKLFATVNDQSEEVVLERATPSSPWSLPGDMVIDIESAGPNMFSVIRNGRSHRVLILKQDQENGTIRMRIGSKSYTVKLQDEQSKLLKTLGLDSMGPKVREIKAPMPGMVINVLVKPGDVVKKNDPILVLEAMKMENMIKAPGDATISSVQAEKGKAVEKGQLLVSFA